MEIKDLVTKAHINATMKGFHDLESSILDKLNKCSLVTSEELVAVQNAFLSQKLMLIVGEVAEAQEALRKGDIENFDEEISDVCLRIFDLSGCEDINLEDEIIKKMKKNKNRPRLHNKLF
jgi:NTP pyrophosphatase (non-canonical NTP hydrolase)